MKRTLVIVSTLLLAACGESSSDAVHPQSVCAPGEWLEKRARSAACDAEMRVLVDKAQTDAEKNSVVSRSPPPATRSGFR